jgi:uncharacterized membrane protein
MPAVTAFSIRIAYSAIALGIVTGAFTFVRSGALMIAAGTAVIALARRGQISRQRRIIECYFPLTIAITLFTLALALPKGL